MPNNVGIPLFSYMQIGLESIWKTAAVATRRFDLISYSPGWGKDTYEDPSQSSALGSLGIFDGAQWFGFTTRHRLDYAGFNMILDGVMGTNTYGTFGAVTTGSNPYAHAMIPRNDLNSYSVEIIDGNIPNGKSRRFLGAKILGIIIKTGIDTPMAEIEIRWLAADMTENFTPTAALALPTVNPMLYNEWTTIDNGTADVAPALCVRSYEISITNTVAEKRACGGTKLLEEFIRLGKVRVQWKIEQEYRGISATGLWVSGAYGSPKLVIGSAANKRFTIQSGAAKLMGDPAAVNGGDIMIENLTWDAIQDATDGGPVKIITEDTVSTIN